MTSDKHEVRRVSGPNDADVAMLLALYVRDTAPAVRTATNEILYWLDRRHVDSRFIFFVHGFWINGEPIGFAESAYLQATKTVVIDYLAVSPAHARPSVFYRFLEDVISDVSAECPDYLYIASEVPLGTGQVDDREAELWIASLKLFGFRVAQAQYWQPRLGHRRSETELSGRLLIHAGEAVSRIPTEAYVRVVESIYYDYYLPWYTAFTEEPGTYSTHLAQLLTRIAESVGSQPHVILNGDPKWLSLPAPSPRRATQYPPVVVGVLTLAVLAMMTYGMLASYHYLGASPLQLILTLLAFLVALLAIMATLSKNARQVLAMVLTEISHWRNVVSKTTLQAPSRTKGRKRSNLSKDANDGTPDS